MRVFKFGGASVKDAEGVKNLARIIKRYLDQPLIVVVSAMAKNTNLLEQLCDYTHRERLLNNKILSDFIAFHSDLAAKLFVKDHVIFKEIIEYADQIEKDLIKHLDQSFDYYYDQIVSYGELFSTRIIHYYLLQEGIDNNWIKAGDIIKTDNNYREGRVDWSRSKVEASKYKFNNGSVLLTQGFLGESNEGSITTLGREGSDYTAAILAYVFEADNVVIWKDVPGMLNADPRVFPNASKLNEISFKEAIELSYYGATVIHPKTLQPLKEKNLPLFVKSFEDIEKEGSKISNREEFDHDIASYILKEKQVLISIFRDHFKTRPLSLKSRYSGNM
jgi:aspartate kinase